LVALQEVSASLGGLEKLMKLPNPHRDYIAADSTEGSAGGGERTVFLYDRRKVSFRSRPSSATGKPKRERETDALTSQLSKRAKNEGVSYILSGDFNIPNVETIR
jgi:hypothetical protein